MGPLGKGIPFFGVIDRKQRFTDAPEVDCPDCGERARRCFVPVGFIFKGPGFYTTDTRPPGSEIPEKSVKDTEEKFKETKAKIDSFAEKGDKSYPKASGR